MRNAVVAAQHLRGDVISAKKPVMALPSRVRSPKEPWAMKILALMAWMITVLLGIFLLAGLLAATKHVQQDYTVVFYAMPLFVLSFHLTLKLCPTTIMKKKALDRQKDREDLRHPVDARINGRKPIKM